MKTPECDKLYKVKDESQTIGEFLDWLQEEHEIFLPFSITDLLAEYFEIDLKEVERERRAILDELRGK